MRSAKVERTKLLVHGIAEANRRKEHYKGLDKENTMKEGVFVQVWNTPVPWKSILEQEVLDTRESI